VGSSQASLWSFFAIVGTNLPLLVGTAVVSDSPKQCTRLLGSHACRQGDGCETHQCVQSLLLIATISAAVGGFSASILGLLKNSYAIDLVTGHRYLFLGVAMLSLLGPAIALTVSDQGPPRPTIGLSYYSKEISQDSCSVLACGILIALGAGMVIPLIPGWALLKFGVVDDVSAPISWINSLVMGFANLAAPRLARSLGQSRQ